MSCYRPVDGFVAKDGSRQFTTNPKRAWVDRPMVVSCGKCIGCRLERKREWTLRLLHENSLHSDSMFLTVTYNDEHYPESGSLSKKDLQLFIKRLRASLDDVRIRYFAVGEYGTRTFRPHYHILLFGWREPDLVNLVSDFNGSNPLLHSFVLNRIWGKGEIVVGEVTPESVAYCAGYVVDKIEDNLNDDYKRLDIETGELFEVEPQFTIMSRRPGIGFDWYKKFKDDVFPDDFIVQSGRKMAVPKYYKRKLKEVDEELALKVTKARLLRAQLRAADNTPERLSVREKVVLINRKTLKKEKKL